MIDISEINNTDVFGEALRGICFKKEYGCYSCFDLVDSFKESTDKNLINQMKKWTDWDDDWRGIKLDVYSNGEIDIGWYWDGDGTLAISYGGRTVVNRDCKKDYVWEEVID